MKLIATIASSSMPEPTTQTSVTVASSAAIEIVPPVFPPESAETSWKQRVRKTKPIAKERVEVEQLKRRTPNRYFPVDAVLGHRDVGGITKYEIKWTGCFQNSWEPLQNLTLSLV